MAKENEILRLIKQHFKGVSEIRRIKSHGYNGYPFVFIRDGKSFFIKVIDTSRLERDLIGQEEKALISVKSDHVVPLLEVGHLGDKNYKYLLFPNLGGKDLEDLIEEHRKLKKPVPNKKIKDIALQIAKGISDLWKVRVVHQDIKPKNIRISSDGKVTVLDLGIARFMEDPRKAKGKGSYKYSSPQQIRTFIGENDPVVNFSDDHFSLGAMLYEMATLKYPFGSGESRDILNISPEPILKLNNQIDSELERVITKLLSKDSYQRYYTPERLIRDLEGREDDEEKLIKNPIVFYQQGHSSTGGYAYFFEDFLERMASSKGCAVKGAILLASYPPDDKLIEDAKDKLDYLVIDPETYKLIYGEYIPRKLKGTPYGAKILTKQNFFDADFVKNWVRRVVSYQVDKGASIIISPYFIAESLDDDWYPITLSLLNETKKIMKELDLKLPLFAGLAFSASVICNPTTRGKILDKIIFDDSIKGVFLVVENEKEGSTPLADTTLIKELSLFIGILERRFSVLVPYLDPSALFLVVNGLSAFSTNPSQSLRKFSIKKFKKERRSQSGMKRVEKVYIPALFNFVRYPQELTELTKKGFGTEIAFNSPFSKKDYFLSEGNRWSRNDRHNSYLFTLSAMVGEMGKLPKRDRATYIKEKVAKARDLYKRIASADVQLHQHSTGDFLKEWEKINP